ncbi:MAG: proton-conducting transporter membrane subunit [Alphaproteobacteria bacterium]
MTAILFILLTPLLASAWVLLNGRSPNRRDYPVLLFGLATFIQVILLTKNYWSDLSQGVVFQLFEITTGLGISFRIDALGAIFALVASGLWIVTTLYAIGYMRGHHEKSQTRFFAFFPMAISAAIGIAFSGDMIILFLFYEALTFGTWPLVAHAETMNARLGARRYMAILVGTSMLFLLPAILITIILTGSASFTHGGIMGSLSSTMVLILLALYAWGIGKAALMPFHGWLPAAMVAPTPVSALLHAVAVVKAGVFTMIRVIMFIFGPERLAEIPLASFLSWAAMISLVLASIIALRQDNLKRRLAYSTIGQLSYITLAASLLNPIALQAASMHIVGHALGKITLFFGAGAIMVASHKTKVSQLGGIGRRMPISMMAFSFGILSVIGLPPTVGFLSKWQILQGAAAAHNNFAIAALIISTLLNCGYFLPILWRIWFTPDTSLAHDNDHLIHNHGEAPWQCYVAMSICASLALAFFIWPNGLYIITKMVVGG